MKIRTRYSLIPSAVLFLASSAFAAVDIAPVRPIGEIQLPPVATTAAPGAGIGLVSTFATPRASFVSGFDKVALPVAMILRNDRYQGLVARHSPDVASDVAGVVNRYKAVNASRAMTIVDGRFRGSATKVRITVTEGREGGLVAQGYAKGDPRTVRGSQNIHANVQRIVQKFRDMALARSENEIFDGDQRSAAP
jgi:hypothetical protein